MHDVTVDDLKDPLEVRFSMMAPFSDDRMGLRVSAVTLNQSEASVTKWSIASNARLARFDKGSDVKIPDDLNRRDGTALIIIDASYEYQFSAFDELLSEAADLGATAYSKPRARVSLDCPSC
ncbi:hypothetical protein GCM10011390_20850 [Aureimonas endophytica]|uniref:Uncharacterized protein n=1 Tax=Aureimonas endophytica TaxID=2027858 RepID=A0A917E4A9_9HYPH|nr:hypothetical protein [Aureimonas endophytica]GGE01840.1 hypothetical protein GCM10011390_20850 [Aureimonas endophytica]